MLPGFADPVHGAQGCFRALLEAMSRPGEIRPAAAGLTAPACLDPATAAALLTLVDGETTLWLDDAMAGAWEWVAFHCGAARAPGPEGAAFACAASLPDLAGLDAGTDEAPESSTTLILQVAALDAGAALVLSGPGLREPRGLRVDGLPADFVARWAENRALYPRGVDLILCAGERLCALPRGVRAVPG